MMKTRLIVLSMTLSVGVVVSVAWFATRGNTAETSSMDSPENALSGTYESSFETAIGKQRTETLPDGTRVTLNTNSCLEVAFTVTHRNIYMNEGEGAFEVAEDERPFRVVMDSQYVEASAAAFTLHRMPENDVVEVLVVDGAVELVRTDDARDDGRGIRDSTESELVAWEAERVPVSSGQVLTVTGRVSAIEDLRPEMVEAETAWVKGILLFRGNPLEEVVEELSRYTTLQIEVDEDLKDMNVVGIFRPDIHTFLVTLRWNFGLNVQHLEEGVVRLTGSPAKSSP